jgi:HEAT repeat protein
MNETKTLDAEELRALVERLGGQDWRDVAAAVRALAGAGEDGTRAVIEGLRAHPNPQVRRGCADWMDHHGDDHCVDALCHAARHDPVAYVRRVAVHSLSCQRCKSTPLVCVDIVARLIPSALDDPSPKVRREAAYGLSAQPPDVRAVPVLKRLLDDPASDPDLRRIAHSALKHHDPDYKRHADERARERRLAANGGAP